MEKITKEELLAELKLAEVNTDDLENVSGGSGIEDYKECLKKCLISGVEYETCLDRCEGVL